MLRYCKGFAARELRVFCKTTRYDCCGCDDILPWNRNYIKLDLLPEFQSSPLGVALPKLATFALFFLCSEGLPFSGMSSMFQVLFAGLIASRLSWAALSPIRTPVRTPVQSRQVQDCNTTSNRACWISNSFDINTDYVGHTISRLCIVKLFPVL